MYARLLDLKKLLAKKSHFLFGPRATGKSWLIRHQLPHVQKFDLLDTVTHDRFLRRPSALAEEVTSDFVIIDEIQKVPRLLDEVHKMIEERGVRFLLTGSSARKLKHGGANLLAGRARSLSLFPLTSREISDFDLLKYCRYGGLPMIYLSDDPWLDLREYISLYIKEEITAEAIVRRVDHFARFLDVMGIMSGEEVNYQKIADDAAVPPRTVANFVEVLKDTLIAFELEPFKKTKKRKATSKGKIYFFDVGVANYLAERKEISYRSEVFGKAFEHFIIQEIRAYLSYHFIDKRMMYWRTVGGTHEVDCIIGADCAIEIKAADRFQEKMLSSLLALKADSKIRNLYLVSRDPVLRTIGGVEVLPYDKFLDKLWAGKIC